QTYAIFSGGKDGTITVTSSGVQQVKSTTNFDCDIIYSNGSFISYPEGVQQQ
ncbi:MAG: hypothetical protein JWO97_3764, partial [Acidobacteria bacterium]|nr:hypothetical protein [Acidobacteriota bacterium]